MKNLDELTTSELAKEYNLAAIELGHDEVKRFSDRKAALRRTTGILDTLRTHKTLPETGAKEKPKGERLWTNFLGMRQDIKASKEQLPLKSEKSIRAEALDVLLVGATLGQLTAIFDKHDKRRSATHRKAAFRAYEMVRIFCYHYGYGTKSSADGKVITLVTE